MKEWDLITNKAMLGAAKAPVVQSDIPVQVTDGYEVLEEKEVGSTFFKVASLIFQIRQSGTLPLDLSHINFEEAEKEDHAYCSLQANAALKEALAEEHLPFVKLWLDKCARSKQVAHAEMIPTLLDLGVHWKEARRRILEVTGKRGRWLAGLNPEWGYSTVDDVRELWETGSTEQRKELLTHLRITDKPTSRELLEGSWSSEGLNEKIAFLEILEDTVDKTDLPWLESLKERSQKVSNLVLRLLKLIPESAVIRQYQETLKGIISLSNEKAMFGILNKRVLFIDETFAVPDAVLATGLEKLSKDKNVTDNQFIVAQLLSSVPPSFLNEHLQLSNREIIDLLKKEEKTLFYLPAVAIAAALFRDQSWIRDLLEDGEETITSTSLLELLSKLDEDEQDAYAVRYFKADPSGMTELMMESQREWSSEFSNLILNHTAGDLYHYNRTFFRRASLLVPVGTEDVLEKVAVDDARRASWSVQSEELERLLRLKKQILQSFNDEQST